MLKHVLGLRRSSRASWTTPTGAGAVLRWRRILVAAATAPTSFTPFAGVARMVSPAAASRAAWPRFARLRRAGVTVDGLAPVLMEDPLFWSWRRLRWALRRAGAGA